MTQCNLSKNDKTNNKYKNLTSIKEELRIKKDSKEEFSLSLHRPTFPHLKDAVSSAKRSLTARFGMELGVASSL